MSNDWWHYPSSFAGLETSSANANIKKKNAGNGAKTRQFNTKGKTCRCQFQLRKTDYLPQQRRPLVFIFKYYKNLHQKLRILLNVDQRLRGRSKGLIKTPKNKTLFLCLFALFVALCTGEIINTSQSLQSKPVQVIQPQTQLSSNLKFFQSNKSSKNSAKQNFQTELIQKFSTLEFSNTPNINNKTTDVKTDDILTNDLKLLFKTLKSKNNEKSNKLKEIKFKREEKLSLINATNISQPMQFKATKLNTKDLNVLSRFSRPKIKSVAKTAIQPLFQYSPAPQKLLTTKDFFRLVNVPIVESESRDSSLWSQNINRLSSNFVIRVSNESWFSYMQFKKDTCREDQKEEQISDKNSVNSTDSGYFLWEENVFHQELRKIIFPKTRHGRLTSLIGSSLLNSLDSRFFASPLETRCKTQEFDKSENSDEEIWLKTEHHQFEDYLINKVFSPPEYYPQ